MRFRLAVLQSHPIQYFSPWFRALTKRPELQLKVFYCLNPTAKQQGEGFGLSFDWDVPLLESYAHEFLPNRAREPGLRFFGCNTPKVRDLVASRQFDAWLIPGWNLKSYWQAMRACWRCRVPMLVRGDSNLLDPKPLHVRLAKRLILGLWIPRFSACLAVGKLNDEYYRFYGADPARLFPVRHSVDNAFFAKGAAEAAGDRQQLRGQWGIPPDAVTFLFCGKLIEGKRPLDLLAVAEKLRGARVPAHFLCVGDGPLRETCAEVQRTENLPVSFAGFLNQKDLPKAYACCDALVLPSRHETWGLVVNEAMACGLPAIVSDRVGCAPDLVEDEVTGFTYPVGQTDVLAALIKSLAAAPPKLREMGDRARNRIQDYSVEKAVDGLLRATEFVRSRPQLTR